jgi:acetyltransferase
MLLFSTTASHWRHTLQLGRKLQPREIHDSWRLVNGRSVRIRAVKPDDGPLMQQLVAGLSVTSRYRRFFYPIHELTPDMLARFTQVDPAHALTLLAVVRDGGREVAVGMAQCMVEAMPGEADFALVVADEWQRAGIATRLLRNLICIARTAGLARLEGDVLAENEPMLRLLVGMEFAFDPHPDGAYLVRAYTNLMPSGWKCSPLTALVAQTRQTDTGEPYRAR